MVVFLPFIGPAIGASVVILGGVYYYATDVNEEWQQTTKETAEVLVTQGYDFLGSVGEGIGTGLEVIGTELGEVGVDIGAGLKAIGSGLGEIGGEVGEDIGAGLKAIGSELGEIGEDLASGALVVIRGAGRAVIDSGENMFDYIASKVSPHRVEAVTAITAMLFYGTTAIIIFKKIRGAN